MLTRFVRNQLIIFTIAAVVGIGAMVFVYSPPPVGCTGSRTSPTAASRWAR
jgi:hypothetical protein